MSAPRLEGKIALITGAASGIGEAAARLFVQNGATVVIADVQDDLGRQVASSIGPKASYIHCNVTNEDEVKAAVKYTLDNYGTLDIMYSNAGILGTLPGILDLNLGHGFDTTIAINLKGVAATIKHAARAMVAQNKKGGSIIVTASVAASVGGAGPTVYTASKHGVVGLVKAACCELGAYGIRVNAVSPFGVGTPLSCIAYNTGAAEVEAGVEAVSNLKGVVLKAEHVAQAALFLASDESAYISGHDLVVDGGFSVVAHTFTAPA